METLPTYFNGATIEALQLGLTRAGFLDDRSIDGLMGPQTKAALRQLQSANGLGADGILGPQTMGALLPYLVGYRIHTIQEGDTLWQISQRYGATVHAILAANPGVDPQSLRVAQRITVPLGFDVVPTNIRYSSYLTAYVVDGLLARYPFLGKETVGYSVLGREIVSLSMGTGSRKVGYNASHHANEWLTTPLVLTYLEDYLKAYRDGGAIGGEDAGRLYRNISLSIVPLVNPDGVDLVTGALDPNGAPYRTARQMAQDYSWIPFPDGWKANINGVDLNLAYPAGWQEARRIKYAQGYTRPGPRDFVGRRPLQEPENQAMATYTRQNDFRLTLSYHSQGRVIYWRYLDYLPPGSYLMAQRLGEASGYLVEETPYASGHAGYKDWFIQDFNRPGYTIEVGTGQSPLPLSQFPTIYRENLPLMTQAMAGILEWGL
ncbi:peptidoglycan-binding protein [Eubacteriales bacterium OttesenSCG-928-M02]|nr:peptidoglycan-binding protein [Eubacteriales bacterium OttesenSCG-928-M02]